MSVNLWDTADNFRIPRPSLIKPRLYKWCAVVRLAIFVMLILHASQRHPAWVCTQRGISRLLNFPRPSYAHKRQQSTIVRCGATRRLHHADPHTLQRYSIEHLATVCNNNSLKRLIPDCVMLFYALFVVK